MYIEKIKSPENIKALNIKELNILAKEIRNFIIKSQSRTGGHVGANTGVVELTIAIHYVFNSPRDPFFWDVGHQVYTHKILTGRANCLDSMRQDGGSPGFPCKSESEHDILDVSHGGTSLSLALGVALANRLQKIDNTPVAIIGDCAIGEGMAFEALNEIGYEKPKMLIILNDNGWGITSNDTAIREYLENLQPGKGDMDTFFSALGIKYVGPIDGHDLEILVNKLNEVKSIVGPVVLHVKTIKGYGLPYAKESPTKYHFSFPFNVETGEPITEAEGTEPNIFYKPLSPFNAVFIGKQIEKLAQENKKVVVITPATIGAGEIGGVFKNVPDRAFDVGMAEQHAMTLAIGMSLGGMKPIVVFQSTFFQRAFDQLVHDACINDIPVMIILARSGLAGLDHATHHAILDLSYLGCVPNLEIHFPADHEAFNKMLDEYVKKGVKHPTIMLFPYGTLQMVEANEKEKLLMNEDPYVKQNDGIILTTAGRLKSALAIKKSLRNQGSEWGLMNISKLKPLDEILFLKILKRYERIVTMEENVKAGGFGSAVLEFASDHSFKPNVLRITLGNLFVEHGTRPFLYKKYNVNEISVIKSMKERWPDLKIK